MLVDLVDFVDFVELVDLVDLAELVELVAWNVSRTKTARVKARQAKMALNMGPESSSHIAQLMITYKILC